MILEQNYHHVNLDPLLVRLNTNIDHLCGFSIIRDLLLSIFSVLQTLQLTDVRSTTRNIYSMLDVARYFAIVKRTSFSAALKLSLVRKMLHTEFGNEALAFFEENECDFTAPLRWMTVNGHVAWTPSIDNVNSHGVENDNNHYWLTIKCKV